MIVAASRHSKYTKSPAYTLSSTFLSGNCSIDLDIQMPRAAPPTITSDTASPSILAGRTPSWRMRTKLLAAVTRAKPTITKAVRRTKVWAVTMVLTRKDHTVPAFSPRRKP